MNKESSTTILDKANILSADIKNPIKPKAIVVKRPIKKGPKIFYVVDSTMESEDASGEPMVSKHDGPGGDISIRTHPDNLDMLKTWAVSIYATMIDITKDVKKVDRPGRKRHKKGA